MHADPSQGPPVTLLCFPPEDAAFGAFAEGLAASLPAALRSSADGPEALQGLLRGTYPGATVRARAELASLEVRPRPTWYVYRDGALRPASGSASRAVSPSEPTGGREAPG
ncbi:MAG TPA: hypothetical protein VIV06_02340 [Candidatus Limnocylindrales bacterium]